MEKIVSFWIVQQISANFCCFTRNMYIYTRAIESTKLDWSRNILYHRMIRDSHSRIVLNQDFVESVAYIYLLNCGKTSVRYFY